MLATTSVFSFTTVDDDEAFATMSAAVVVGASTAVFAVIVATFTMFGAAILTSEDY
jgi:membrane associated rhomboid family serine protease